MIATIRKFIRFAAACAMLFAGPVAAQTTNCRWVGSTWQCMQQPGYQPPPPIQQPDFGQMLRSYRAGREDRQRNEERQREKDAAPESRSFGSAQGQPLSTVDLKAAFCIGYFRDFRPFDVSALPEAARALAERLNIEVTDARRRLASYFFPRTKFIDVESAMAAVNEGVSAQDAALAGADYCLKNSGEALCIRRSQQAKECREAPFLPF